MQEVWQDSQRPAIVLLLSVPKRAEHASSGGASPTICIKGFRPILGTHGDSNGAPAMRPSLIPAIVTSLALFIGISAAGSEKRLSPSQRLLEANTIFVTCSGG